MPDQFTPISIDEEAWACISDWSDADRTALFGFLFQLLEEGPPLPGSIPNALAYRHQWVEGWDVVLDLPTTKVLLAYTWVPIDTVDFVLSKILQRERCLHVFPPIAWSLDD